MIFARLMIAAIMLLHRSIVLSAGDEKRETGANGEQLHAQAAQDNPSPDSSPKISDRAPLLRRVQTHVEANADGFEVFRTHGRYAKPGCKLDEGKVKPVKNDTLASQAEADAREWLKQIVGPTERDVELTLNVTPAP